MRVDLTSFPNFATFGEPTPSGVEFYDPFLDGIPGPNGWEKWICSAVSPFIQWSTGVLAAPTAGLEKGLFDGSDEWDPQVVDYLRSEWVRASLVLDKFNGWAICISNDQAEKLVDYFIARAGSGNKEEDEEKEGSHSFIYQCILETFPNGKTAKWEDVVKQVGYSRRSINRALDAHGGREWWAGAGRIGRNHPPT